MRQSRGRPRQPFLTEKGEPRLRAVLTPRGPIEYRPGQAIIDLRRFDDGSDSPAQIVERIGKLAGVELRTDETDAPQSDRSRFLRVYFDPRVDVTDLLRRADREIAPGAVVPNTVFRIGSFTADPMHFSELRRRSDALLRLRRRSRCTSRTRARHARPSALRCSTIFRG